MSDFELEVLNEEKNEGGQVAEGWKIENDQQADWAVKKIKDSKADLERWEQYYTNMIEKVRMNTQNTVDFMTAKLAEFFQTVPHKETKTMEKYPLPSGDLVYSKPKEVYAHDDDTLLNWLKENGLSELVKVKEKPDWAGFKKRLVKGSDGVLCDSETGLVCDVVTCEIDQGGFEVKA